ncbi:hypothetical protein BLA29_003061, partial [Euroglyphus maynei]
MTNNHKKDQIQRTVVNKIVQQQQQQQQTSTKLSTTNILSSSSSSTTANTNKFVQVTSQAAALAANNGANFLNPSFFVPGVTPTFTNGFHSAANFPTFHSAFMPTIFNQQLSLNNVQLPGAMTTTTANNNKTVNNNPTNQLISTRHSNPFFPVQANHHQQPQSQLTIFTSPPLPTGATAAALSPFSFPGAMQHSTLLSTTPQFSPSSSAASATTAAAPLLMPKSTLNFPTSANLTFPGTDPNSAAAAAAANSLMMFGIASAKSSAGSSWSSNNTTTTTSPPFILPRIVQTTSSTQQHNLTANANTTATVIAKSLPQHNKSNKDKLNAKQAANLSPAIQDVSRTTNFGTGPAAITILPNTASPNTHPYHHSHSAANQQHSPLSTIISPQTLLLLQSPLSTATTSFSTKQIAHYVSSSASVITSANSTKSLTPIKPATTTINIVGTTANKNAIMSTPSISTTTTAATQAAIKSLATNTNSVILTPNSTLHQHLPYTLFSQPSPALMQPISIQAPPAPSPSSVFGTPLLLSVISPTGRNGGPQHYQQHQPAAHRSNLSSPVIITNAPTTTTTLIAKNTDSKTQNPNKSRQSELKNIQPKMEKSTPKTTTTQQLPVKLLPESKKPPPSSTKCNIPTTKLNEITSNTLSTPSSLSSSLSSSAKSTNEISPNKQQQQSSDIMIMKSPQTEEFESLVRSVKDTIDSFNAASS